MKSFLLLFSVFILSACTNGHNPLFNCDGPGCGGVISSGIGLSAPPLSFTKTLEQGYWYSRYNLGDLVMKSGAGETFMPDMDMVSMMLRMTEPARAERAASSGRTEAPGPTVKAPS